jgi:hypothetical protein
MSTPTRRAAVAFIFIGAGPPPGLCSLCFTPAAVSSFYASSPKAHDWWPVIFVPFLIGFTIFGVLLWWLIRTWRVNPS